MEQALTATREWTTIDTPRMTPPPLRLPALILGVALAGPITPGAAAAQSGVAPREAPDTCSRIWTGQERAFEDALTTGVVTRVEPVPVGVTKPQRATLAPGGPAARFAWKPLPPQRRGGYRESYKAEIAAYRLDRLLDLGMVPPVVERTMDGKVGAAILWIEHATGWDMHAPPRGPEPEWSRQVSRMKLFDQLIANIDRNQGNLLYDADWHLFLIDHSRAFTTRTSFDGIAAPNTIDRRLWARIDALTDADLSQALGAWLTADERRAILTRRDHMRTAVAKLVKARGAARVFLE
ncbi:MAG: hypothetical protein R2745_25910 [Vicinamibacterales bacterium]